VNAVNSDPPFRLRLFGRPCLVGADGALLAGRAVQRHRLALLALLVLAPGRSSSRERLLAYLWPESDTERARNLLNVSVYVLRQELGDAVLLSDGDDLRLDPGRIRTDVEEFEAALQRGDSASALTLYQGPLLDGFFLSDAPGFEHWLERERDRLANGYAKALETLAEAAMQEGDFLRAAEWWKARAAHDPFDSRVALRLMLALDASGNRAGALQHASIHERLLQEELGIEPAPELRALVGRLRNAPESATPELRRWAETPADREIDAPASSNVGKEAQSPTQTDSRPVQPEIPPLAAAINGGRVRGRGWLAAALLALAALVGAVWAVWPRDSVPERSIVVLPFLNLSPDEDNDYFSDGLTEEIITHLSAIPELKVISRTSAMHYKGSKEPLRRIADELNVAHVLEGSVRQSGGRVRITALLIGARADAHLWAKNYDYELRDIFRVQEEIAREVARALEINLEERGHSPLVRRGTRDPEAYQLYRRGRFLWNSRTKEGHEQAIEYYRRAIERDPSYADAYAGLSDVYLTAFQLNLFDMPEAEAYSRMKWASERALALDDRSADAHTSFAIVLWWQRNWPGTERELRRAIELNPNHATARSWYSLLLGGWGRMEEALREGHRAYELDPFAVVVGTNYARKCYLVRDYDCAAELFRKTLEVNPSWANGYRGLGLTYAQMGMHEQAIHAVRKAVDLRPERTDYLADLAYVQALAGETEDAREILDRAKIQPWEAFSVARAHVALGEPDSAFAWFERSNWRWPQRAARNDPALDPLRADPRFADLSAQVEREMGIQ
jgi:TolB-like protein/DNA-binding SARP family transcriptional activator/Flp pilus assembly protein TadD